MFARGAGARMTQARKRSPSAVSIVVASNGTPTFCGVSHSPAVGKKANRGSIQRTSSHKNTHPASRENENNSITRRITATNHRRSLTRCDLVLRAHRRKEKGGFCFSRNFSPFSLLLCAL